MGNAPHRAAAKSALQRRNFKLRILDRPMDEVELALEFVDFTKMRRAIHSRGIAPERLDRRAQGANFQHQLLLASRARIGIRRRTSNVGIARLIDRRPRATLPVWHVFPPSGSASATKLVYAGLI